MTSPRRLVALAIILLTSPALAQEHESAAGDRAALVAERYKGMLKANPVEGLALDRLWKYYEERGASAGLVDEYRCMTEAPGAGAPVWLVYGHLLQRAGRLDDADASFARAETLEPASPLPLLARADLAAGRSEPGDAVRSYALALEKLPAGDRRQPEILFKLGTAWISAGQPLKAADAWERIIARDPGNLPLRRQLAETYEKNGLPERALVQFQYIETHADPAERAGALRDLARLHEAHGEFDAARDALERGLTLTARDNWLHGELERRLIRLYQRAGRLPELEARWRAAADAAPRDLGALLRLEALAQAQGDAPDERRWLERLVALAPREREYTLELARRLVDDGDRPRAAALYDGLLKAQPDNLDLILARADLDLQLGQPAAAVDRIEARIARNPADESVTTPALAFFLEHHLDAAAEKWLRADVSRHPAAAEPALALVKFLFGLHKVAEARVGLEALTALPGDPVARAARWMQAAEVCREQNLPTDALHAWQEAEKLQPRVAAPSLAAGEYLLARGDKKAAADQFEHAAALARGDEQIEAERKWFSALQDADESGNASTSAAQPLARRLAALETTAAAFPNGDNFLRLARWQSWGHLSEPAMASAARAIEADPANLAARQLIVDVATELRRPAQVEAELLEMIARDPAHKVVYQRQLATLKLDYGDQDAAVAILTQLQQAAPGSREALTDLALAQQRADRWFDALATWERAYALPGGTPSQRDEIRRPLLAAYERIGQFPRAAEVLRAAVDEQTDPTAKTDLFHELAAFCHRHELGSRLREDYEKRLAARPDDYFLLTALAELRRDDGQGREAYALSQQAYYSSPDPARSLRELADQAEQLGEDSDAVGHQRRLVALSGQSTAANLERLAALEEADLEDVAAAHTWEDVVAKFPRDPAVLGHAAEYFQKVDQPDRARALLRQLVAVDGTASPQVLRLATLDAQAGDTAEARSQYEQLLAHTTEEAANETLVVPTDLALPSVESSYVGGSRLLLSVRGHGSGRSAPAIAAGGEDQRLRLQAIEGMSRLLFPKDLTGPTVPNGEQTAWLRRWGDAATAGAKSGPLAAFYFAGQGELTLGLLARWTGRDDSLGETATDAFLQAGLRLRGYARLADWAWHGQDGAAASVHGRRLLGALETFLGAGGKPGLDMVAQLFPADLTVRETLWTAAQNGFAANHWYAQAAELGERVLGAVSSGRSGYGIEVAEWEVYAGNPDRAREALRRSIDDMDGDSFETGNPVFTALRSYYLMLPEGERPAFVAGYLGRPRGRSGAAHAVLSAALLHGLSGDERAAERDLDQLLAMRMISVEPATLSPDIRRWAYLLANGEQLQAWNLDSLAVHLWRQALREAGGFDQRTGDVDNTVIEIRRRLLSAEVATAPDPQQAGQCIAQFLGETSEPAIIGSMASELWTDGQRTAAARLYEILCQTDPANGDYWTNLFSFYETTGNDDGAERLLTLLVGGSRPLPGGMTRAELTCSLAMRREKRGDVPGACRLLEHARQSMSGAVPILLQLAQTYERAGRWDDAAVVWREAVPLDQTHAARLGLAANLERAGHRAEAAELLRGGMKDGPDPGRVELAVRFTQLLLADQHADQARVFAFDLITRGQLEPLPAVCAAFAAAGQQATAREILSAAVLRSQEPVARFHLQQALVEQFAVPGSDSTAFVRQMRRLRRMAQTSENLRGEYEELLYPLAHRQGADEWLESEFRRAWKGGLGDPAAGTQLAGLAIQNHREDLLREVVQTIDHHADLPEKLLYALATSLVETDHAPLALALCERLAKRFPQKQEYALERALALWKSERRAEADQVLEALAVTAAFRDDVLEAIAGFYLGRDEKIRASDYLARIVRNDPLAVRSSQSFVQLAQILIDERRLPEAGHLLRVAYARPACEDLSPLVHYLKANGDLEGEKARDMPARDFPLTFTRRARLLAAVREQLDSEGRAEEGQRLIEAHAEFLAATPTLAAELARKATPVTVATVADCLERGAAQHSPPPASLAHQLAALYAQWAVWDTNVPTGRGEALAHLGRAFELEPDDFSLASALAKLCLAQNQPERASSVLAAFLRPDALPSEREQANRILAH